MCKKLMLLLLLLVANVQSLHGDWVPSRSVVTTSICVMGFLGIFFTGVYYGIYYLLDRSVRQSYYNILNKYSNLYQRSLKEFLKNLKKIDSKIDEGLYREFVIHKYLQPLKPKYVVSFGDDFDEVVSKKWLEIVQTLDPLLVYKQYYNKKTYFSTYLEQIESLKYYYSVASSHEWICDSKELISRKIDFLDSVSKIFKQYQKASNLIKDNIFIKGLKSQFEKFIICNIIENKVFPEEDIFLLFNSFVVKRRINHTEIRYYRTSPDFLKTLPFLIHNMKKLCLGLDKYYEVSTTYFSNDMINSFSDCNFKFKNK